MKRPQMLTVSVTNNSPETIKSLSEFLEIMDKSFEQNKNILQFAKDLDAYSTVSFNHSVNVALQFYHMIKNDPELSKQEKEEWTMAAFVHDAGKLTTPTEVLHSTLNYRDDPETSKAENKIMMRHSIDGLKTAEKYGFTDRMTFAVVAHHVDATAIENNFNGATKSRGTWEESFTEEYGDHPIDRLLSEKFSWTSDKDREMIEKLTVIDCAEATRSTDRWYRGKQQSWDDIMVFQKSDSDNGKLNPNLVAEYTNQKSFQNTFDELQSFSAKNNIRYLIFDKGKDLPYTLSGDKITEIFNNPQCGIPFFKKEPNGSFTVDVGDGCYFDVPQKDSLPHIISQAQPSVMRVRPEIVDTKMVLNVVEKNHTEELLLQNDQEEEYDDL